MTQPAGDIEPAPLVPHRPVAPDTHPLELERLALQERSHPDCDPLQVQATIWLFRAYGAAVNSQADELRVLGLSPSGFNVLMALLNTPGHTLEPCQLADRLLVSRPSVTGLLDTLQSKGLVTRRRHGVDRRRVLVELTDAAHGVLSSHFPIHYREQAAVWDELSPDELGQLVSLLRRVRGAVPAHLHDERDLGGSGAGDDPRTA
ncbi:MAG: MarR family transcriptional regulator [Euzebyales bacterium]|nr:MarR family transcriptional regulator [Euzebyales bacterium]